MIVAVESVICCSPTSAAAVSSTVPASTPSGTLARTANWLSTDRAADSKAAVSASALVAVTTLPFPASANFARDFSWLPSPSDTASRMTPDSARTARASLADAGLSASLPSESRTTLRLPSAPNCSTVVITASLSVVPPPAWRPSIAAVTAARSMVGATATSGVSLKETSPALTSAGSVWR